MRLNPIAAFGGGAVLAVVLASHALAAPLTPLEQRGQILLTRLCSSCHAVGRSGNSPHVHAPEFRHIADRYDIDDLIDKLSEGFTAPHPDMPTFTFTRRDAQAAQAYLKAIQQ